MTTEAEDAAGRELREKSFPMQPFSVKWEDLKPEIRSEWVRDAMDIVRAYQRAAWRGITEDDRLGRTVFAFSWKYKNESTWRGPFAFPGNCLPFADDNREFLIRDLLPLPEPKS